MLMIAKPIFRLSDQQKRLLIDLTPYIDYCQLTSTMDYVERYNTLGGSQDLELIKRDYRISIAGYNFDGLNGKLFELQSISGWHFLFEYSASGDMKDCLFGKAYVTSISMGVPMWDLELVCANVSRGRISEEEQKAVVVIKQGRRIAREE